MMPCSKQSRADAYADEVLSNPGLSSLVNGRQISLRSLCLLSGDVRLVTTWMNWQASSVKCAPGIYALVEATHNTPPPPVDTSLCDDAIAEVLILCIFHKVLHLSVAKKALPGRLLVITDHKQKDDRWINFSLPHFLLFLEAIDVQTYFCPVYMLTVLLFNWERDKQNAEEKPKPDKKKPEPKPEEKKPKPERKGRRVPQEPREPKTKVEGSFTRKGMEIGFV